MKTLSLALLLLVAAPAPGASARSHESDDCGIETHCCDFPTRWGPRHATHDARIAVTTEDGDATLVLTDELVAVQLSDRKYHDISRKLRDKEDGNDENDDNPLAIAIKTAVFSGVRSMLAHSAECPIRELRSVEYRDGRLIFITRDDDRIFRGMRIDDQNVMDGFSEKDARAFVREFVRAAARR
jgi:hypothetical protein